MPLPSVFNGIAMTNTWKVAFYKLYLVTNQASILFTRYHA